MKLFVLFAMVSGWAMAADPSGVPNFHQVDEHLYRGAQPTLEGFQNLAKLGVKTVIDLRESGDRVRREEAIVAGDGMHYIHVPMNGYHAPSNEQISGLLALLNQDPGPVFIHCRRGADRTGTVVACYRIARQNWSNDKALTEAEQYGMGWTEWTMKDFLRHFIPPGHAVFGGIPAVGVAQSVAAAH